MREMGDPGRTHNVVISGYRETNRETMLHNVQMRFHWPECKLLTDWSCWSPLHFPLWAHLINWQGSTTSSIVLLMSSLVPRSHTHTYTHCPVVTKIQNSVGAQIKPAALIAAQFPKLISQCPQPTSIFRHLDALQIGLPNKVRSIQNEAAWATEEAFVFAAWQTSRTAISRYVS